MNKNLHRVVFNAARGLRMAVQETAMSMGKATGASSVSVGLALAGVLAGAPAHAQITSDPNAPGTMRPTVLPAANGVPVVNIQTPSAAGVSRNVYSRFDVQRNGVILNNSRRDAQTQLGGWVSGNPWLARGPARVILNEISSGNPTQLRGAIEVAGPRTEVIVANPAGIAVDGLSFINVNRATLTTGVPQFDATGGLDSFVVREGTVSVEGLGLDARTTDYAAILARAQQINASLWANDLKVVGGANQVSADHSRITPIAGSGPKPRFVLDVALLGGMYANKIFMVGTEAGLGVRNHGSLYAGVGEFVVTADGKIVNRGTIEAPRVELSAPEIDNSQGTIRQTGTTGLTVTAPTLSNTQGGVIGAAPPSAPSVPLAGGGAAHGGAVADAGSTGADGAPVANAGSAGTPAAQPAVPLAPGSITAPGGILNDGGRILAGGGIGLDVPQIDNSAGFLSLTRMAVSGRAADLAEVAKHGVITPDQAERLAQTLLELAPIYGSGESALQLITGKSSLTGEEANRIWAAVGLVPIAGGMVRKVGEPAVETLTSVLRALDGPVYKTTREATQAAMALGYRRINETINGQAVYTDGKKFITRDIDSHSGGAWKLAGSVKDLASKETRTGTFDSNLNRIGD